MDEILNLIESVSEDFPSYSFCENRFSNVSRNNAESLNIYCNRWCKQEHVECDALKDWKLRLEINYLNNYRSTYFLLFSKYEHVTA